MSKTERKEDVWPMKFVKVENIEEAQYWIPIYDERFVGTYHIRKIAILYRDIMNRYFGKEFNSDKFITYNKPYKLQVNSHEEYYIIDDNGERNFLWNIHRGYFVKETDT